MPSRSNHLSMVAVYELFNTLAFPVPREGSTIIVCRFAKIFRGKSIIQTFYEFLNVIRLPSNDQVVDVCNRDHLWSLVYCLS